MTFCPSWLAPNLITLLGLVAILVNIVSIAILVPDFVGPGPTWMYWSFVIGLWIYSTLDNIDGKQARRTGNAMQQMEGSNERFFIAFGRTF